MKATEPYEIIFKQGFDQWRDEIRVKRHNPVTGCLVHVTLKHDDENWLAWRVRHAREVNRHDETDKSGKSRPKSQLWLFAKKMANLINANEELESKKKREQKWLDRFYGKARF